MKRFSAVRTELVSVAVLALRVVVLAFRVREPDHAIFVAAPRTHDPVLIEGFVALGTEDLASYREDFLLQSNVRVVRRDYRWTAARLIFGISTPANAMFMRIRLPRVRDFLQQRVESDRVGCVFGHFDLSEN